MRSRLSTPRRGMGAMSDQRDPTITSADCCAWRGRARLSPPIAWGG